MESYNIGLVNLEIFMNKKYFNHFSYQVSKDLNIEIESYKVFNSLGYPHLCIISFSNIEDRLKFIKEYKTKFYSGLNKQIEFIDNQEEIELLKKSLIEEPDKDLVIKEKEQYENICESQFEKNYNDNGLVYTNQQQIEKQKSVVAYLIKKIGTQFMKGESIMNISMPVNIFDERSLLQRYVK